MQWHSGNYGKRRLCPMLVFMLFYSTSAGVSLGFADDLKQATAKQVDDHERRGDFWAEKGDFTKAVAEYTAGVLKRPAPTTNRELCRLLCALYTKKETAIDTDKSIVDCGMGNRLLGVLSARKAKLETSRERYLVYPTKFAGEVANLSACIILQSTTDEKRAFVYVKRGDLYAARCDYVKALDDYNAALRFPDALAKQERDNCLYQQ